MTLELVPWQGRRYPVIQPSDEVSRYSLNDYFSWVYQSSQYGGLSAPAAVQTTYGTRPAEPIGTNFVGFVEGLLYRDGPVASAEAYRLRVFGQAPMLFQERTDGRPGDLYDDESLDLLRTPWFGGNTGDLMKRALVFGDFGGTAFIAPVEDELVVLRPDWVEILLAERYHQGRQVGFRQAAIAYYEGGLGNGDPAVFLPGEYTCFIPFLPDPLASYRGMSWLTPIIREVMSDKSASDHKLAFFENAATPNLAVSLPKEITPEQFDRFVESMDSAHKGALNAYKTLYTAGGADVTVIGANMQQMDFGSVQGKTETRIANASGVPATLLGFAEGMQGSSLNSGNYQAAKRNFVDTTMRDLWQNWCGSMQPLFPPPTPGARLWYDHRDIPFLHEDQKDAAEIQNTKANTINAYVMNGFDPASAIASVDADDRKLLKHTGLVSVQLLPPGEQPGDDAAAADDAADASEYEAALRSARSSVLERAFNPKQLRIPQGHEGGGRFRKLSDIIVKSIKDFLDSGGGDGEDPLKDFTREQLRRTAKELGIPPRRGASVDEIKLALLKHVRGTPKGKGKPAPSAPVSTAKDVEAGDFSGLKRVGEQGGANPGGVFEAGDGSRWYVKAQRSPEHANNEALASAFYQATGIDAPKVIHGKGTPDLPGEDHTATRLVPDAKVDLRDRVKANDGGYLKKIHQGFAVDAWLANWDVAGENPGAGWDNIVSSGGDPIRIDAGGALLFRGLGKPKGAAFGPSVTEWDKFRDEDSPRASANVFKSITVEDVQASVDRVKAVTPAKIRKLVADHGMDPSVAETLVARRKDLISRMKAELKAPKSAFVGLTGSAALDAAPIRQTHIVSRLTSRGVSESDADDIDQALRVYQDGAYKWINQLLLGKAEPGVANKYYRKNIDDIRRAMDLSPLTNDVIVYRGERNPARNFPKGKWSLVGGMEGAEWTFKAFASTSTSKSTAEGFGTSKPETQLDTAQYTVFKIRVPEGTKAIALDGIGESELLLTDGLRYRVVKDYGVQLNVRYIDVEVVA